MTGFIERPQSPRRGRRRTVEKIVRRAIAERSQERDTAVHRAAAELNGWSLKFRGWREALQEAGSELSETSNGDSAVREKRVENFDRRRLEALADVEAKVAPGIPIDPKYIGAVETDPRYATIHQRSRHIVGDNTHSSERFMPLPNAQC
jgi:hypothetical protein